ncbi:reverse transcriptase domain-containing protein [Tanacetum coccineum]
MNTSIKLLLFPFSLDGEARDWLDKEPPRSILTWDDLVSKFINQFFPPSKTTYYQNEIITFFQKPNETFNEAWERFKGLLRQCPHHGFSQLHQLDTFYNSLNSNDQDALDSAAGGNFLDNMPQEGLAIIKSKCWKKLLGCLALLSNPSIFTTHCLNHWIKDLSRWITFELTQIAKLSFFDVTAYASCVIERTPIWAVPGGLIGVGTTMDPISTRADGLVVRFMGRSDVPILERWGVQGRSKCSLRNGRE